MRRIIAVISLKFLRIALRHIKDLIEKAILRQQKLGGRSVNYELKD